MSKTYLGNVRKMFGKCPETVWKMFGKMFGRCLENVWKIFGDVWNIFEKCLEIVWKCYGNVWKMFDVIFRCSVVFLPFLAVFLPQDLKNRLTEPFFIDLDRCSSKSDGYDPFL